MKGERTPVRGNSRMAGVIALLFFCLASSAYGQGTASGSPRGPLGYRALASSGDHVLACGSGDRIDILDTGGIIISSVPLDTIYTLTDIAALAQTALALSDDGKVILLEDGQASGLDFQGLAPRCVEAFGGCFLFACDGAIFTLDARLDFICATPRLTRGEIISMSSYGDVRICALSDEAEFIFSEDGRNWGYLDLNRQYEGYYPELEPVAVASGNASYAIAGTGPDGEPLLFLSSTGSVWNPRELSTSAYTLDESILNVVFDPWGDRMVLLCSGGLVFFVPGCSHCNSFTRTRADNLYDAHPLPGSLLVAGDDSFVVVL